MIDPAFRARADAALTELERREGVRVLLAIESGSRAWGFASRDSDYDVRSLYLHSLAEYLSITPPRDVLEQPIDDALDLGGWDLRKALGLLVRSNAVVLEWLCSPVVYRCDKAAVAELTALAQAAAHLPALAYHYDRLARGAWATGAELVRMKSYFYALRPALALLWLRQRTTPPPMDLPTLLAGVTVPEAVTREIEHLRQRKADATERDVIDRQPVLEGFLSEVLDTPEPRPAAWGQAGTLGRANNLFRHLVGG